MPLPPASTDDNGNSPSKPGEQSFAPPKRQRLLYRSSLVGGSKRTVSGLAARARLPPGQLHLRCTYPGAVVWIGGRPVGTVPMIWESGVAGEECSVEYRMPGFSPVSFRVVFPEPGETVDCLQSLDPEEPVEETRKKTGFSSVEAIREALHRLFLQAEIPVERQIELLDKVSQDAAGVPQVETLLLLDLYENLLAEYMEEEEEEEEGQTEQGDASPEVLMISAGCGSFVLDALEMESGLVSEGMQTTMLFDEDEAELEMTLANGYPSSSTTALRQAETQTPELHSITADAATEAGHVKTFITLELVCEEMKSEPMARRKKGHRKQRSDRPGGKKAPPQMDIGVIEAEAMDWSAIPHHPGATLTPPPPVGDGQASPLLTPLRQPILRESGSQLPVAQQHHSPNFPRSLPLPSYASVSPMMFPSFSPGVQGLWPAGCTPSMPPWFTQLPGVAESPMRFPQFSTPLRLPDIDGATVSSYSSYYHSPFPAQAPQSCMPTYTSVPNLSTSPMASIQWNQLPPMLAVEPPTPVASTMCNPRESPTSYAQLPMPAAWTLMPTAADSAATSFPLPQGLGSTSSPFVWTSSSGVYPLPQMMDGSQQSHEASLPQPPMTYPLIPMPLYPLIPMQPRIVNFMPQQALVDVPIAQQSNVWSPHIPMPQYPNCFVTYAQ